MAAARLGINSIKNTTTNYYYYKYNKTSYTNTVTVSATAAAAARCYWKKTKQISIHSSHTSSSSSSSSSSCFSVAVVAANSHSSSSLYENRHCHNNTMRRRINNNNYSTSITTRRKCWYNTCGVNNDNNCGTYFQKRLSTRERKRRRGRRGGGCMTALGTNALFRLGGNDSNKAGIYGSQGRDDYCYDDVEQYFNYTGMLAVEGNYNRMNALFEHCEYAIDVLLLLASEEGDVPKIEELLNAGASKEQQNLEGKSAIDIAKNDEVRELISSFQK